jgi:thioredoxin reductase
MASIVVIGSGPGGMFFCHAMETYRRELEVKGDKEALAKLPKVTCLERASGPGGVWRSQRIFAQSAGGEATCEEQPGSSSADTDEEAATTNMYEALWTNGPKEALEFFDHTFVEHFGEQPLPVYMPRQAILDYMLARVTKSCPDFFDKYMTFDTSVVSVKYVEYKSKYEVIVQNMVTKEIVMEEYDTCIWTAGRNGKPKMPTSITSLFREGGFTGKVIHSSDSADFETNVKSKRVLIIGGGYSAEDLALTAIKVGVEKVFISIRWTENVVSWTGNWPQGKVQLLPNRTPVKVTGNRIQFAPLTWMYPDSYIAIDDKIEAELSDIDTVILCTGYDANMDMLDEKLREAFEQPFERKLSVPTDWTMEANSWSDVLGEVAPSKDGVLWHRSLVKYDGIYRGFLIANPSMIFLENEDFASPIFGIDGNAWLLMRYMTGQRPVPFGEEMRKQNEEDALRQMQVPYIRYYMDRNYYDACNKSYAKLPDGSWETHEKVYYLLFYRIMARTL